MYWTDFCQDKLGQIVKVTHLQLIGYIEKLTLCNYC